MTRLDRLLSTAARAGRATLGGALGLGLLAGLLWSAPPPVLAQTAPAPVEAPAAAATPRAEGGGPALWVVRDADSTLYLFGTVHVLRPTTAWGSDKVDAALAGASDVYFEVANPEDQAALLPLIRQYGLGREPLSHQVTSGQLTLLDNAARQVGSNAVQMDPLRPWLAGLTLSVAPLIKAGYDPNSGAELVLKGRAVQAGKPIHGFETLDQQVRVLATLPEDVQLQFLSSTLEEFDDAGVEIDAMVAAWARGDVEALARTAVDPVKAEAPAVYDALFVRRNADWANQIQTLLAGSGVVFIAVGAAHLAGEDSVQAILQARGVAVERE